MQKVIFSRTTTRKQFYRKLRGLLAEFGHTQEKLTVSTGKSESYVNERMTGRRDRSLVDCYNILDFYDVEHELLPIYFPKEGLTQ